MKLVILLSFILNLKLSITYFFKEKSNLKKDFDTFEIQSFLEKSTAVNKMNSHSLLQLKTSSRQRPTKQFKAKIYIFKDQDPLSEKPHETQATIKLTDSLEIYEKQKLTRKISFLE